MHSKPKQVKFYRIIGQSSKPKSKAEQKQPASPQKLTQQILKNNHYVYIDINTQNGVCEMESINPEDADADTQKIDGSTFICAINKLPAQSQKVIDYVYKLKEFKKQKQHFKKLLKRQLKYSTKRQKNNLSQLKSINKQCSEEKTNTSVRHKSNNKADNSNKPERASSLPFRKQKFSQLTIKAQGKVDDETQLFHSARAKGKNDVIVYRGMQTKYLKQYLQKKQLQQINTKILERQKLLIAKYGFTNEFQSIIKQKSIIVRKHKKIILPQIKSVPNIIY